MSLQRSRSKTEVLMSCWMGWVPHQKEMFHSLICLICMSRSMTNIMYSYYTIVQTQGTCHLRLLLPFILLLQKYWKQRADMGEWQGKILRICCCTDVRQNWWGTVAWSVKDTYIKRIKNREHTVLLADLARKEASQATLWITMTDQQQPSFLNITRSKRFYYESFA